jgi:hypothetical protein
VVGDREVIVVWRLERKKTNVFTTLAARTVACA